MIMATTKSAETCSSAIQKLLGSPIVSADTRHKRYAVLSQRLALDINIASPIDAEATLEQITNHMRVCVKIGEGIETLRGIAASEPILSEAASYVMQEQFDLADALSDVLSPAQTFLAGSRPTQEVVENYWSLHSSHGLVTP